MVRLPRWLIFTVAILLIFNPVITATLNYQKFNNLPVEVGALVIYVAVGIISVVYYKGLRMPLPLAIVNLAMTVLLPQLVNSAIDLSSKGSFATWYVTGVATLMAITAVRQHVLIAWSGTALLTIQIALWGGIDFLFNSGLAGAFGLVITGHLLSVGLERSARETEAYLEMAKTTEAESAAESAIRSERSKRLTATLEGALPMLEKIASANFDEADRDDARLLEAQLRDEIRGRNLLNDRLRLSLRRARARGIEAVVLDEGGLETITEEEREMLRDRVSTELDAIESGRVTIRAPHQDTAKVTFVASRPGTAKPDVFLRL